MHLKRLAAPRFWPIHRKVKKWTLKPRPGSFAQEESISLGIVLRDVMGVTKGQRESKKILNEGMIKLNGKICRDPNRSVGIMDVLEIVPTKASYRALPNKYGIYLKETKAGDAFQFMKIVEKRQLKGRLQYAFHNGSTYLSDKKYAVGDTIKFKDGKVADHLPFAEGNHALITAGSKVGNFGTIKSIKPGDATHTMMVQVEKDKQVSETIGDYVFVIGQKKLEVDL